MDQLTYQHIQRNTFTRWCNILLKDTDISITNIYTDFCDGLKLIALLEVLSGKEIKRFNKKPRFRPQKLENIQIALKFMVEDLNVRMCGVGASDIFKGNTRIIVGILWLLILQYQISSPALHNYNGDQVRPGQALMSWINHKLQPNVSVGNFSSSWSDGVALSYLVDAVAPGLLPDPRKISPENALKNVTEAMQIAEDYLCIPQIITSEEFTHPNVDQLSVMTYLSYFVTARLKDGTVVRVLESLSVKSTLDGELVGDSSAVENT